MKSFASDRFESEVLTLELGGLLHTLGEHKGRQELFTRQSPQVLKTLREAAIIQSSESSNRIEGVVVAPDRLKAIMARKSRPRDRSEAEVAGYRDALAWIHASAGRIRFSKDTILRLHKLVFGKSPAEGGGAFKRKDNTIEEQLPSGRWITRFEPVSARETPYYIEELCKAVEREWAAGRTNKLLIVGATVLDFLSIHPFADGNGRVARLLTLLLLYHAGYEVGRYISLERIIEDSKESYYETLQASSKGWHEARHRLKPWWGYFLSTLVAAYREFEQRVGTVNRQKGAQSRMVRSTIENLPEQFTHADIEKAAPGISRPTLYRVLSRMQKEGAIKCLKRGRNALWRRM